MSSISQNALYVDKDCHFSTRSDLGPYKIGHGELLIQTLFSGVNPGDVLHSTLLGMRSMVLGYDFCGRILSASPNSKFKEGDIVAGCTTPGPGRPAKYGAHQSVLVCAEDMAWEVPSGMSCSHAAALTVVVMTAADALYNWFGKPMPSSQTPTGLDKNPLLIWGASSSVGICAVQFARASGVKNILVTASPARHELLKSLGATQCFDYASPTVTDDILAAVEALGQGPLAHALDAVGSMASTPTSAELVARCAPDPGTCLACVVLPDDKRFRLVYALPKDEFIVQTSDMPQPVGIPARVEDHWRSWEALHWAIANYGERFVLPVVDVVAGTAEQGLDTLKQVAELGKGFGKVVIKHPMA
ncbi:hypothetical protein S40288_09320 [Stachybotrys chartarum IBT 40288]|nr:hypothetical protein S40288_09320 [Stachybotrys chartarum IBT 40288]